MKQRRTACRATRPFRNLSRQKQYIMEAAGAEEEIDKAQRSEWGKDTHLSEKAFPPGRRFSFAMHAQPDPLMCRWPCGRFPPPDAKKKPGIAAGLFRSEVPPGFEPGHKGFADLCLTAWLWHLKQMER